MILLLMKLKHVKFENVDNWHNTDYLPDTPREILLYTEDFGTTSGYYQSITDGWFSFRWQCYVYPIYWREMPRYDSKSNL